MQALKEFEMECPRCGKMARVDWVSLEGRCEECGFEFVGELPEEVEVAIRMFNQACAKFRKWGFEPEGGVLRKIDLSERLRKLLGGR